jgi:hypothetical protein
LKNQNIKHFNCDSYGASSCIPLFRAQDPVAKAGGRGIRRRGGACWGGRAWRRLRKRASREHRKEKKNNGVSQSHSVSSAFGLTTKLKKNLSFRKCASTPIAVNANRPQNGSTGRDYFPTIALSKLTFPR